MSGGGSCGASPVGQVDEDGLYPAVHVGFLAKSKLREDRVDVLLDDAQRDEQRFCDGLVVLALCHVREDIELARAQLAKWRDREPGAGRDETFDNLRVDDRSTGSDLADRVQQLGCAEEPVLEQIGATG